MASPLPMIASNTEETAYAALEGNEILEKVNVAIINMSSGVVSSLGQLTGAFMNFSEYLREQNAAMLAKFSLSEPSTDQNDSEPKRKPKKDSNGFIDDTIEKGLMQAAQISILASLTGIFTNMTTWMGGIVTAFTKIGKNIVKFAKLGGRLFLPLTLIIGSIGAISASWKSFAEGDIWTGLEQAVTGFVSSILTIPLDLLKDGVAWLARKMGFDESADFLDSFSFTELYEKLVSVIFDGVKEAFKVITDLFAFSEEDKTNLGLQGKFIDLVFAPVNMAIGFVKGLFGFSEEGAPPFKLQDWIDEKTSQAVAYVRNLFSLAGDTVVAGWTGLTDYVSQVFTDVKTWFTDKLTWASDGIGAGWTSITDFVSGVWTGVKTWFTDKLTLAGDDIGAGWTSLTDFISGVWTGIKTWFTDKLTLAGEEIPGVGFITKLVSDAWDSVTEWFNKALAGIAESLPSLGDIKTSIISKLPSFMIPDSYKTPQMLAADIGEKIAETRATIEGGPTLFNRSMEDEKVSMSAMIAEQNAYLAQAAAERRTGGGSNANVNIAGGSSSTTNNRSGDTIIMSAPSTVGGMRPDR
jgi:hypothetical protein